MGRLIDDPDCVVCADRHLSFSPALLQCLPIMQNMHGEGLKTSDGDFMNYHKAVHKKYFDVLMSAWKLKHELSATYADKIPHEYWTSYTACIPGVAYCLHNLTDSQLVEGKMNRLKKAEVRHELPLTAMNNFITLYSKIVSKQGVVCDTMRKGNAVYTQYATIVIFDHFSESRNYDVKHWDETLPHVDLKGQRGQTGTKSMMPAHETGWAKSKKSTRKGDNPFKKTNANIEEKSLEKALQGEALEPDHALCGARAAAEEEMRRVQEEEKKEAELRHAVEEEDFNSLLDEMFHGHR
ncbi:hypothetical protein B484DRAFT_469018 [Ochromonadaceae sp. CCMP2298]|nr:hypothetical protein B484DRAFT_469018 [Ochromonadaceae sp. CCMP2298]